MVNWAAPLRSFAAAIADASPNERRIVRLKALLWRATTKEQFLDCLNRAKPVDAPDSWKTWYGPHLNPVLSDLRGRGLLGDDLTISAEFLHEATIEALGSDESEGLLAAMAGVFPKSAPRTYDDKVVEANGLRWMRLDTYLDDPESCERVRAEHERAMYRNRLGTIFQRHFAPLDVGIQWFMSRNILFRENLLSAKMDLWISTGTFPPDLDAMVDLCIRQPDLAGGEYPSALDYLCLTGRLSRLDEALARPWPEGSFDMAVGFRGARILLAGDVKGALPMFEAALKSWRKHTRKRKGGLPGCLSALHLHALLASADKNLHPEISILVESKEMTAGQIAAKALLSMAQGKQDEARREIVSVIDVLRRTGNPSPLSAGLVASACALIAPDHLLQFVSMTFIPLFKRVSSMPLAADILAEAIASVAADPEPFSTHLSRSGREVSLRFLSVLGGKAAWEMALDGIEGMLSSSGDATASGREPERTKRISWFVNPNALDIFPLEQSKQPKGWSGGRAVALKRLHDVDASLESADADDWRVAGAVRRDFHYYNKETFRIDWTSALRALIGHPRVFSAVDPTRRVEIVEGRAEIVVASVGDGFRLSMSHPAVLEGAHLEIEAPDRWRVVVIDGPAVAASAILSSAGVTVPKSAKDRISGLAKMTETLLPLRIDTKEIQDVAARDGDSSPVVRLMPLGDGLKVSLVVRPCGLDGPDFLVGHGARTVSDKGGRVNRDLSLERDKAADLVSSCPSLAGGGPEWIFDDLLSSLDLLGDLKSLPEAPAMEWPEGETLKVRGTASAKVFKAGIAGSEGWFSIGGTLDVDEGEVLGIREILDRMDAMQGRFVPLGGGAFVALDDRFRKQLDRLRKMEDGGRIPSVAGAAVRDLVEGAASVKADGKWKAFMKKVEDAEIWIPTVPSTLAAELRDYQTEGFAWMSRLDRWSPGALLADDMGLGKTVQSIALLMRKAALGPSLVVCPTSVAGNWVSEIERFAPGLRPIRLAEAGSRDETLSSLSPGDVVVCSYGLLSREEEALASVSWAMAVLDEAQAIKNAQTRRAKAAKRLEAGFRLALTGTPVENDLDELRSIFSFAVPGLLGSQESFAKRFGTPVGRDGDPAAKTALKALVRPFILRRTKTQVLSELPSRTEQTLLVERSPEEGAFYEALRRRAVDRLAEGEGRTRIHILAELTRLRQACCDPALVVEKASSVVSIPSAKREAFMELVDEMRKGGHRALVFSQFVGHLSGIRKALDEVGIPYQYLDGSTPPREREKRVADFQAGVGDLFLISLKAGGSGLNLTAADYVVHLDPWWNPAVEDQASDRAHRIGQTRPVTIYRLVMKDSVEEGIVALHGRKRDLADALLDGADAAAKLTEEDLLDLIRGIA